MASPLLRVALFITSMVGNKAVPFMTNESARHAAVSGPFLYVTFHGDSKSGGINQIYKYSLDGALVADNVLHGAEDDLHELRAMAIVGNELVVANAYKGASKILVFSACDSAGARNYVGTIATSDSDKNLLHPYGLAASTSVTGSWLYVSNQDSNDVTRYAKNDQNKPASAAPFFDAGKGNGVRGVAFDILNGLLFVADSDKDVVHAIDQSSGKEVWKLDVSSPIGLYVDQLRQELYIGSHDKKSPMVRTYNVVLKTWGANYTHHTMTHPAGITKHDDVLYVLCQDQRALISFDAQGQYIADVVAEFKDDPEQMIMSPC